MPRPANKPVIASVTYYDSSPAAEYKHTLGALYYDPIMLRLTMMVGTDRGAVNRIAQRSGVSAPTIRNWMQRKTHRPTASTMRFVARTLGYDLELVKRK